jgi:hypothetical protein
MHKDQPLFVPLPPPEERSGYPGDMWGDPSWKEIKKTLSTGYLIPQTPGKICQKPTHRLKREASW